ncbi:MAG: hypothetical protein K9W44_11600 [Candidatus Lokiarchaeota archaeon]|nr:hypothetical protein [Candidatus Harpocratesius repetitus]
MNTDGRIAFLVDLFHSIDIREKGIEYIYDLLLQKQSVEDIKEFIDNSELSLKRTYKVIQLLEKLGLIQVYNRPMIVNIKDPISSWEILISEKIKQIRTEADRRIENCEICFHNFVDEYKLNPESISVPPVEFININPNDYSPDFFKNEIIGKAKSFCIAKGDIIKTSFNEKLKLLIKNISVSDLESQNTFLSYCKEWKEAIPSLTLEVLITEEYLHNKLEIFKEKEISFIEDLVKSEIKFDSIKIKVTKNVLTNFLLKNNNELIQYSTSPDNALIGLFISRQHEICEIFTKKYTYEFDNAINLDSYYIKNFNRSLTIFEIFYLTLI